MKTTPTQWIHCTCTGPSIGYNRNWVINFWAITRADDVTTFACPKCRAEWSVASSVFRREWSNKPVDGVTYGH